ncbi:MAG: hypothetical protein E6905_07920, partial [Actinomyces sp.]|nr:hypothetical protein [Actinomyces sp.]
PADTWGFSDEDLLADADAFLLAHSYWRGSEKLSDALTNLRSMPAKIRAFEFYQNRFGGSVDNVRAAFWDLINDYRGTTVPLLGGPLTWASHADRLPDKDESERLAALYAEKLGETV